jgi:hypothetical protein
VAVAAALLAGITPWLFELSRLVFEVAAFPLALALCLLAVERAARRERWGALEVVGVAATLALVSYAYSLGKLLGPLLALGLVLFARRGRRPGVAWTWLAYGAALLPMALFAWREPLGFTMRLRASRPAGDGDGVLAGFLHRYLANLDPWGWVSRGDPIERHHVAGSGSLLAPLPLLAALGLVLAFTRHRGEPLWRFVAWGLAVSVVPASLTADRCHALRLAALPVFLLVLAVPALVWLGEQGRPGRLVALSLLLAAALQSAHFHHLHRERGPLRERAFDADYPEVLARALASGVVPLYLPDPSSAHAEWYGVLAGVERRRLVRLEREAPPPGGLVVGAISACPGCPVLARRGPWAASWNRPGGSAAPLP